MRESPNMQPALKEDANRLTLTSVARGAEGFLIAQLQREGFGAVAKGASIVYVTLNDRQLEDTAARLSFFAPGATILKFPAWDCLPYDRVSPLAVITAQRVETLSALAAADGKKPLIVLTTINALLQRVPPKEAMRHGALTLKPGTNVSREALVNFLVGNGYRRVEKTMEPGEFALRGSIIDIFPPGWEEALRLDCFGDEVESLRRFDPLTQLTTAAQDEVTLRTVSEIILSEEAIDHFRAQYRAHFGAVTKTDPLYEALSDGRSYPGMEHWLPLFYDQMSTLTDYLPAGSLLLMDYQAMEAASDRHEIIRDYYDARKTGEKASGMLDSPYHPLPPESLYVMEDALNDLLASQPTMHLSPFAEEGAGVVDTKLHGVPNFSASTLKPGEEVFEHLRDFIASQRTRNNATLLACYSQGSRERVQAMLGSREIHCVQIEHLAEYRSIKGKTLGLCVLPLEHGFEADGFAIVTEQDLLGERVVRVRPKKRKAEAFLSEAANFIEGELVVHREHGIGRFDGLVTLEVNNVKHDCVKLTYADDDRLFLPVENIDLLTRYGSEEEGVALDKLGGAAWQARAAKLKERIKLAAEELMKTAAARALKPGETLSVPTGLYDAFVSRFGFAETEDQARAIDEVAEDLHSGKPMDRLICGDVGFGKTEVALRAAFIAANAPEGKVQVAVIAPTTLLARQHYRNFKQRFDGFGINVRQLSRLATTKDQTKTREMLKDGSCDIVIGTHALLAKSVEFANLGLVIVDEEQHFGVAQKEKLKSLKADVHVLTLSATPIPRTLQLAMSGVRELSLITTPPVDRLAIRTFVMPFDEVIIREAILREQHRGGQVFYVAPRIQDLVELRLKLEKLVPEVKLKVAHGQMPPSELDSIMNEFYDGTFDVLLSTAIVESGLDIPTANTIIIHRADMFGLAQLYQLRGRVGRGKQRAYAYLTLPHYRQLTKTATRRLEVMQTLDTLGAGFSLASHDMDIRGFGNLVGEEQSGHIREVGIELYQQMLADAVEAARQSGAGKHVPGAANAPTREWSPQINLGISVLIPEEYVPDINLRLSLYRRLAHLTSDTEIESFAAELVDRFGKLPKDVENLIAILHIKHICYEAGIERVDTGPKGAVLTFRHNTFANPEALLAHIAAHPLHYKLRPDQKLVVTEYWKDEADKLKKLSVILANVRNLR